MKAALCWLALSAVCSAEIRFFKATTENTALEGGLEFETVAAASEHEHAHSLTLGPQPPAIPHRWHWLELADGGFFATTGGEGSDAPVLRTLITGLEPSTVYQVDGFFRAETGKKPPQTIRGDIRMGLTIARTEAFGPVSRQGLSCIIGEDHKSKRVTRQQPRNEAAQPAGHPDFPLFRVSLGAARSDAQGTLVVFIDDQPNDTLSAATFYEGVAVSPALEGEEPVAGGGSPQALVEAVRVNDRETMERELAAGANLNTPDREGLTALFYACVAGDRDLARRFLNTGAQPDAPNQRLTPLWAAARNGEAEITNDLLDAGSGVSTACLSGRQPGFFMRGQGPVQINPVSAALLSGSVATVEALLKKHPDIDLGKAVFGPGYEFKEGDAANSYQPHYDLIGLSMGMRNFDMTHWLIVRGHSVILPESPSLPQIGSKYPQFGGRSTMVRAIMRKSPRLDIVDALAARGVPLIVPEKANFDPVIVPWDALSAAAFEGHADLVRRWLPLAKDVVYDYRIRLITLADASGCKDSAALVREAFPNTEFPAYYQTKKEILTLRERSAGDVGGFVPRTKAPQAAAAATDTLRLAIIGTGAAAGPADALAAHASSAAHTEVVDREQLATTLVERDLSTNRPPTASQLNDLGDFLKADVIVTAASLGEKADAVLRFEAHDVHTGLTQLRVFQLAREIDPQAFAANFLAGLHARTQESRAGKSLTAITLLGIAAEPGKFHGAALSPTVHAGLLQEIDATPGLTALTRDQLAPLVAEQALGQEGSLWGAAWTIEGGLRKAESPGHVTLALRLRPANDESKAHDITVEGPATAPRELVQQAWALLQGHIQNATTPAIHDPAWAGRESARLAREAAWLLKTPLAWQAAPLADASLYLGGDRLDQLMFRQQCHWAACMVVNPRAQWRNSRGRHDDATGYPVGPAMHQFYLYWLEEHLELLRLTAATADQALTILHNNPERKPVPVLRRLWMDVGRLTEYRGRLLPEWMDSSQKAMLADFDHELRQLWESLVSHQPGYLVSAAGDGPANRLLATQRATINFHNPAWPGELMAREILRGAAAPSSSGQERWAFGINTESALLERFVYPHCDSLAMMLRKQLSSDDPLAEPRNAEIAWITADGPARIRAAKTASTAWTHLLATRLLPPNRIIDPLLYAKSQASHGFGFNLSDQSPFGLPLASLVAAPRKCVDLQYRYGTYHVARQHLAHASRGTGDWPRFSKTLGARPMQEIKSLTKRRSSAADFDLLMTAALETDAIYGTSIASTLEAPLRNARPKDTPQDSFGTNGGFRVAVKSDALPGEILTNLRAEFPESQPVIVLQAVDHHDRNLLWLVVSPVAEKEIALHEYPRRWNNSDRFPCRQPWLLGIDCSDGSIVRRINLIKAAFGESAPEQAMFQSINCLIPHHLVFNDEGLMLLLVWPEQGRNVRRALAIRRADGGVIHSMAIDNVHEDHPLGRIQPAMVGLDRDFYLLACDLAESKHYKIWRLPAGGKPVTLNTPGRRPVETPFDATDRNPNLLQVDAGKILVASSWNHHAYFDPATSSWSQPNDRNADAFLLHARRLDRQAYHATLYPQHILPLHDGCGGRFAPPSDSEAGALIYYKNASLPLRLPLSLPVDPADASTFRISPMPTTRVIDLDSHLKLHMPESVTIQHLARSDMARPAILNQTDEHLIVGLYLAVPNASGIGFWSREYLPYLWKIPKSAIQQRLTNK